MQLTKHDASPIDTAMTEPRWTRYRYAIVLLAYALLILLTRTRVQADTNQYVYHITEWIRGRPNWFWEFGHALWRPVGFLAYRLTHWTTPASDEVLYHQILGGLTAVTVASGALALVAFLSFLERVNLPRVPAVLATLALGTSSAFLAWANTGSAYVPAIAMLIVGMRTLAACDETNETRTVVITSVAFALAVLFWVPMVLGVPGAAVAMVALRGVTRRRTRTAVLVCLISGSITILVLGVIGYIADVRSYADLMAWISESSHSMRGLGGVPRAVLGFGRSVVNVDRLGLIGKRMLIGDPYNPATMTDVLSAGLLRLAIFYLLIAAISLVLLRRPQGRRALAFLALTAFPVLGFALTWQGGDLERYLALFPALFLCLGFALAWMSPRIARVAGMAVVAALVLMNVPPISRYRLNRVCDEMTRRMASVPVTNGKPVLLITPHDMDEITTYRVSCPWTPLAKANNPRAYGIAFPNMISPDWRRLVTLNALKVWPVGGTLWISQRAFMSRPAAEWAWAEGDDPDYRWSDFPEFFRQLDVGPAVGGADGFVQILPTPRTKAVLDKFPPPSPDVTLR